MKIVHLVPSLEDRHGGTSKAVRALANAHGNLGKKIELLTTKEVGFPITLDTSDAVAVHLFLRVAPRWLSRSPELLTYLRGVEFDCLHYHSLWLLPLHYGHQAARRLNVPLVISPHGMMSGWAYRHHRWRKRLAELFVHPGAFAGAAGWHATSQDEADDIRALGFTQPICVSPNGVVPPTVSELTVGRNFWHELCPATRHRPVALFYSRFHRKKRLRELIALWLSEPRGEWLLLIVGVAEEYTVVEIEAVIRSAGAQESIMVFDGANRPQPYAVASLFVLPSHSENFGLVIAEALAAGVPALVTDTTPWRGLATHHCGWCVPWKTFNTALESAQQSSPQEREEMGARGRRWVERDFSWESAGRLLLDFYRHLQDEHH